MGAPHTSRKDREHHVIIRSESAVGTESPVAEEEFARLSSQQQIACTVRCALRALPLIGECMDQ